MKISKNWLSEFSPVPNNVELENELTQLGLEVDSIKKYEKDYIIDIEFTPNRGDCLSVYGTARDLCAYKAKKIKKPLTSPYTLKKTDSHIKEISNKICPEYRFMSLDNVNLKLKTPALITDRLIKSGISPVNLVVDVSNYVMIELGQPTHAFDRDKIHGRLSIKSNIKKNIFIGIDNKEYIIEKGKPVIVDEKNTIHALPGVLGSKVSAVTDSTKNILFESAFFIPDIVRKLSRDLRVQTDSSYRFERGVDPALAETSLGRIHYLLKDIILLSKCRIFKVSHKHFLTKPKYINFEYDLFERILGIKLNTKKIKSYLLNLGFIFKGKKVLVPSYRFDVSNNYDLVEEVSRLYGYNKVPLTPLTTHNAETRNRCKITDMLVVLGYNEVLNFTFIPKNYSNKKNQLILNNPISKDKSVMRESLLPGILSNISYNSNRQQKSIQLFEKGKIYRKNNRKIQEINIISGALYGYKSSSELVSNNYRYGIGDLKADILSILPNIKFEYNDKSIYFDADNSLKIYNGKTQVGECGIISPMLLNDFGIKDPVFAFEILENNLKEVTDIAYKEISQFPAVFKDITLVASEHDKILNVINQLDKRSYKYMKNIRIKDIFINRDNLQLNNRNVTLEVCLQSNIKTLSDKEINYDINKLISEIKNNYKFKIKEA